MPYVGQALDHIAAGDIYSEGGWSSTMTGTAATRPGLLRLPRPAPKSPSWPPTRRPTAEPWSAIVTASLAGDAPLAALTARRLGSSAVLWSATASALDHAGRAVLDQLDTAAITHQARPADAPDRSHRN